MKLIIYNSSSAAYNDVPVLERFISAGDLAPYKSFRLRQAEQTRLFAAPESRDLFVGNRSLIARALCTIVLAYTVLIILLLHVTTVQFVLIH